jgi:Tol biopolymer transport system component
MKRASVIALVCALLFASAAAETPRGITIDRISRIKYPSAPAWSPDGTMIAFLWDAWGKQDLFVVAPPALSERQRVEGVRSRSR